MASLCSKTVWDETSRSEKALVKHGYFNYNYVVRL